MGTLTPFLLSTDARSQAEFYTRSLGGEIVSIITHGEVMGEQGDPKDKVIHLCLSIADGNAIFMADTMKSTPDGSDVLLNISYKTEAEAREAFQKLALGGNVRFPLELQPFGYYGEVQDQYGVSWMITADSEIL
ncbi:VOC family protein [Neobacillus kokaensis]|uniref:PhnB-like domain-containing protein n=1 Tax=Neobacillus kokaensis TaxID=2759023 RepID=A0ABQ3N199_9BACI|nr:VOC family protein [Neobacillus kokaensis]GHH98699.1 hypothetical protein AM1BK_22420 [Neobacillus kokaensis]